MEFDGLTRTMLQANIIDWTPSSNNANTGTGSHGACCNEME